MGGDAERLDFTSDLFEDDVRPQTGQLRAAPTGAGGIVSAGG